MALALTIRVGDIMTINDDIKIKVTRLVGKAVTVAIIADREKYAIDRIPCPEREKKNQELREVAEKNRSILNKYIAEENK